MTPLLQQGHLAAHCPLRAGEKPKNPAAPAVTLTVTTEKNDTEGRWTEVVRQKKAKTYQPNSTSPSKTLDDKGKQVLSTKSKIKTCELEASPVKEAPRVFSTSAPAHSSLKKESQKKKSGCSSDFKHIFRHFSPTITRKK